LTGGAGAAAWINFQVTNRLPRRLVSRAFAWFSRIEQPLVRDLSIAAWQCLSPDLDLAEARKARFTSLHDCFIRELRPGARSIDADPNVLVSPCDAIVGAAGPLRGTELIQAKGLTYTLDELLLDPRLADRHRDGCYVTLRLKASMYHRFHAPASGVVRAVARLPGDRWNVNPPAVARVERLYCRNERAVLDLELPALATAIAIVPVAAILVGGIRIHGLPGARRLPCHVEVRKGQELGYFEHGSTILLFAPPPIALCGHVRQGITIRMGQPLLHRPAPNRTRMARGCRGSPG
jgi:phosphatidylserine decarboxylase